MMRRISRDGVTWLVAVVLVLGGTGRPVAGQEESVVAFEGVSVVPMDTEQILEGYTVVVRGDRIWDMGPAEGITVPDGAIRIDGTGKYLMPGLAEMHGHTPGGPATPEMVEMVMFLYAANGVTTVRGMLGQPGQLDLKARTNSGAIWGPTLYLAGPSFNGNSVDSPAAAEQRVRDQKAQGWDILKVHPGLTAPEYDAMARTAAEVGIRFGGHVPAEVGIVHAIHRGQETFDHLDGFLAYAGGIQDALDERKLDQVMAMTRDAGAWVVPTMVLWEVGIVGMGDSDELRSLPEMRYWPDENQPGMEGVNGWARRHGQAVARRNQNPEMHQQWARNRMRLLNRLQEEGVGILMGTDSPQIFSVPGFSLHREMDAMARAGLSPYEILVSGTRAVGEYFQSQDSFGTVRPGRRADLILLNGNPLADVANVANRAGVMVRGQWKSESEIQERLDRIAASHGK